MHTAHSSSRLLWGVSALSACWDISPQAWACPSPGYGPGPLRCGLGPPGCGPGQPPSQTPNIPTSPRVWAWTPPTSQTPPTSPPGSGPRHPRHPPLWTEFFTHASENITLSQLRCGAVINLWETQLTFAEGFCIHIEYNGYQWQIQHIRDARGAKPGFILGYFWLFPKITMNKFWAGLVGQGIYSPIGYANR